MSRRIVGDVFRLEFHSCFVEIKGNREEISFYRLSDFISRCRIIENNGSSFLYFDSACTLFFHRRQLEKNCGVHDSIDHCWSHYKNGNSFWLASPVKNL